MSWRNSVPAGCFILDVADKRRVEQRSAFTKIITALPRPWFGNSVGPASKCLSRSGYMQRVVVHRLFEVDCVQEFQTVLLPCRSFPHSTTMLPSVCDNGGTVALHKVRLSQMGLAGAGTATIRTFLFLPFSGLSDGCSS
jgi:hypothetical protein